MFVVEPEVRVFKLPWSRAHSSWLSRQIRFTLVFVEYDTCRFRRSLCLCFGNITTLREHRASDESAFVLCSLLHAARKKREFSAHASVFVFRRSTRLIPRLDARWQCYQTSQERCDGRGATFPQPTCLRHSAACICGPEGCTVSHSRREAAKRRDIGRRALFNARCEGEDGTKFRNQVVPRVARAHDQQNCSGSDSSKWS